MIWQWDMKKWMIYNVWGCLFYLWCGQIYIWYCMELVSKVCQTFNILACINFIEPIIMSPHYIAGDPLSYHSFYIAVCLPYHRKLSGLELISYGRLGSTVKKNVMLCCVDDTDSLIYHTLQWTHISQRHFLCKIVATFSVQTKAIILLKRLDVVKSEHHQVDPDCVNVHL